MTQKQFEAMKAMIEEMSDALTLLIQDIRNLRETLKNDTHGDE